LTIKAPISGTVVKVGVNPGEPVDTTIVLAELVDLKRLEATAAVPATELKWLKEGQPVEIRCAAPAARAATQASQPKPAGGVNVSPPAAPKPPPGPLPPLPVGGGGSGSSGGGGSSTERPASSSSCVPVVNVTYIKIFTVAPTKSVDGSHITIWATGLHIKITQPSPGPGVPSQTAEYVLGEGFVDLQAGARAGGFRGIPGFGGLGGFGGGGDFGGFGDQSGAGTGPGSGAAQLGATLAADRVPLALMFLTLEALLLASAAGWVWARSARAEKLEEEVLSP
jgi:hypothetical protein